ncbi:MAG: hypothetical protein QNJ65_20280, partial [Xenococcaceae cyanobacterium MO_234.B1]|nr:hypothetical protein [Xenococcaceae cyanobacterium MO_234.B1]
FWDYDCAEIYLSVRATLTKHLKGLTSTEKTISLDLIATGITTGIWADEIIAVKELRDCFDWLEQEKISRFISNTWLLTPNASEVTRYYS